MSWFLVQVIATLQVKPEGAQEQQQSWQAFAFAITVP